MYKRVIQVAWPVMGPNIGIVFLAILDTRSNKFLFLRDVFRILKETEEYYHLNNNSNKLKIMYKLNRIIWIVKYRFVIFLKKVLYVR